MMKLMIDHDWGSIDTSKVRDMGMEMCASYESFRRLPFTIRDKTLHFRGHSRRTDHRSAFQSACDWLFAAAVSFSEPLVVSNSLLSIFKFQAQTIGVQDETAEEAGGGVGPALQPLPPPKFGYFDAKVSQVEALYLNEQYKKASIYGCHTIEWMARCKERGVEVVQTRMINVIHS